MRRELASIDEMAVAYRWAVSVTMFGGLTWVQGRTPAALGPTDLPYETEADLPSMRQVSWLTMTGEAWRLEQT